MVSLVRWRGWGTLLAVACHLGNRRSVKMAPPLELGIPHVACHTQWRHDEHVSGLESFQCIGESGKRDN